jgi:hypothetical protein
MKAAFGKPCHALLGQPTCVFQIAIQFMTHSPAAFTASPLGIPAVVGGAMPPTDAEAASPAGQEAVEVAIHAVHEDPDVFRDPMAPHPEDRREYA